MNRTFTISENYNSFLWLPAKTASSTLSWIFAHFDFHHYIEENGKIKLFRDGLVHFGHETNFPPQNENMSFIVSIANPYDRVFSLFKMGNTERKDNFTKDDFDMFVSNHVFNNKNISWKVSVLLSERKPNYVVRKEYLFEDLLKIPFIKSSKLNHCGILEDMCNKKINSSFEYELKQKFFDYSTKEKIYEFFKSDFEYFDYSK